MRSSFYWYGPAIVKTIKDRGVCTNMEVKNHILKLRNNENELNKSILRRVCDVIYVLDALGVINRQHKTIRWVGIGDSN